MIKNESGHSRPIMDNTTEAFSPFPVCPAEFHLAKGCAGCKVLEGGVWHGADFLTLAHRGRRVPWNTPTSASAASCLSLSNNEHARSGTRPITNPLPFAPNAEYCYRCTVAPFGPPSQLSPLNLGRGRTVPFSLSNSSFSRREGCRSPPAICRAPERPKRGLPRQRYR